ncbi:MAG: hypothetical protein M0005_04760 [Actinomycetota bacterium]|jgi:hypothetical protein|nr:hypothetical protein [Actinomycetota bacterium]
MDEITKSKTATVLLAAAAALYAFGTLLGVVATSTFGPGDVGTYSDLFQAADWLQFVASLAALAAVCSPAWQALVTEGRPELPELAGAGLATLLVAVAALVLAASPSSQSSSDVVGAVGIGGWGLLALARAGRLGLAGRRGDGPAGSSSLVPLWLVASGGLVALAVGAALAPTTVDQGLAVASGVVQGLGLAALTGAVFVASSRGFLQTAPVTAVAAGLATTAAAYLVSAVAGGFAYAPGGTLTEYRVGLSLASAVLFVGVALLGLAAWARARSLASAGPPAGPAVPGPTPARPGSQEAPPPHQEGQSSRPTPPPPSPGTGWPSPG